MNETEVIKVNDKISFGNKHRFLLMIVASFSVTFVLVFVSLAMYNSSGAAQLDLSRPGYVSVRSQAVTNDADFQNYSTNGEINQSTISEFQLLFTKQANKAKSIDAFVGDPLSPDSLGIGTITE